MADTDTNKENQQLSEFDRMLQNKWDVLMEMGIFKYRVDFLPTKIMGKLRFVVQANTKRGASRRQPDAIFNLEQRFDPNKFNFLKIGLDERMFCFDDPSDVTAVIDERKEHQIVINNSPIEYGSCLLVPHINRKLPQVLNESGLRLAIRIMLMSDSSSFRIAYNSLGGNCSVNHLHFHMYYLRHKLYLETAPLTRISEECYTVEDYPGKCFVFVLMGPKKIDSTVFSLMKMVRFLVRNSVAHNLFITRGESTENDACIRLILWARKFAVGAKGTYELVPASSELSGQIIVWDQASYDTIEEEDIVRLLSEACDEEFQKVKRFVENTLDGTIM
ncbi:Uncharacterised protein g3383 [Pycnogonum litorale]